MLTFDELFKAGGGNPYHDKEGKFATADAATTTAFDATKHANMMSHKSPGTTSEAIAHKDAMVKHTAAAAEWDQVGGRYGEAMSRAHKTTSFEHAAASARGADHLVQFKEPSKKAIDRQGIDAATAYRKQNGIGEYSPWDHSYSTRTTPADMAKHPDLTLAGHESPVTAKFLTNMADTAASLQGNVKEAAYRYGANLLQHMHQGKTTGTAQTLLDESRGEVKAGLQHAFNEYKARYGQAPRGNK